MGVEVKKEAVVDGRVTQDMGMEGITNSKRNTTNLDKEQFSYTADPQYMTLYCDP